MQSFSHINPSTNVSYYSTDKASKLVQVSSIQHGISVLNKAHISVCSTKPTHIHSTLSLKMFTSVAKQRSQNTEHWPKEEDRAWIVASVGDHDVFDNVSISNQHSLWAKQVTVADDPCLHLTDPPGNTTWPWTNTDLHLHLTDTPGNMVRPRTLIPIFISQTHLTTQHDQEQTPCWQCKPQHLTKRVLD